MNTNHITEQAVRSITDIDSLLTFCREHLEWQLPDSPTLEDCSFEWDGNELHLNERQQERLSGGIVSQIRPMFGADDPWGIFVVQFNDTRLYKTVLRQILRALVPKRRKDPSLKSWQHENILFICLTGNNEFSFAHFRGEKAERAKLVRFSWSPDEPIRTLCEFNLPALRLPESDLIGIDPKQWIKQWQDAFDVEKVTEKFFEDYKFAFAELQKLLLKQTKKKSNDKAWAHDYALQFLNRMMFLYFIQKKHWLDDNPRFIKYFWDSYRASKSEKDSFFSDWLSVLFFRAFNEQYHDTAEFQNRFPEDIHQALLKVPFLNGGLFTQNKLDSDYSFEIPDSFFELLFDHFKDERIGFLERYNFTITEDTPLDQEVAVDPEMIGKVYESLVNITFEGLTEEDLRGKSGIFYTPRIEIDLMCRLALVDRLANDLGDEQKNIVRRAVFAYSPDEKREADAALLDANLWNELDRFLRNVTVLDPACGSGSFLIGMLLILDDLLERANNILGNQETAYDRRKRIIGQSLYGVDVMEWAVHVAELRLWLQLAVETNLETWELKARPLLPNLSFKVRRGDSLVQEVAGINFGLHREHLAISQTLKGKLTALKGEKLKFFQGEFRDIDTKQKAIRGQERKIFQEILNDKVITLRQDIYRIQKSISSLDVDQITTEGVVRERSRAYASKVDELERIKGELEEELQRVQSAVEVLRTENEIPFIWDVAFVEIFESDTRGFDIVVGNPPYVRQEKIADPSLNADDFGGENSERWKKLKAEYKVKLQRSVYEAYPKFFGYKRQTETATRRISGKADLYIFFYLHGLSLLNEKGSFSFITSNSWLDVGYGSDLQEFLLRNCHVKLIIDNENKRSFAQADVNTMICLFSAPTPPNPPLAKGRAREGLSRFVMFKVPFEYALSPIVFEEIEEVIPENDEMKRLRRSEFRVVAMSQKMLFEEGMEIPEDVEDKTSKTKKTEKASAQLGAGLLLGKYAGDKWGGKYLRAPEIFFTILEKGKDKLVRLGDIAEVRFGIKTGANEFFYLDDDRIAEWGIEKEFLKPVIKSPRECKSIMIDPKQLKYKIFMCHKEKKELKGTKALKYIEWGENDDEWIDPKTKKPNPPYRRPSCTGRERWYDLGIRNWGKVLWAMIHNDRPTAYLNLKNVVVDHNLFEILHNDHLPIWACLCSSMNVIFRELIGRSNLGEGALKTEGIDIAKFFIIKPELLHNISDQLERIAIEIDTRVTSSVFTEFGIDERIPVRSQQPNPLPDRKALDDIIFDALGLTQAERNEVYWSVCELVKNRLEKAKSV